MPIYDAGLRSTFRKVPVRCGTKMLQFINLVDQVGFWMIGFAFPGS